MVKSTDIRHPTVSADKDRSEDTKRFNRLMSQRFSDEDGKFMLAYIASRFPVPPWTPGQPVESSIYRDGQMSVIFKLSDAAIRGKKGE